MFKSAIGPRIGVILVLLVAAAGSGSAKSALDLRSTSLTGVSDDEPAELLTFAGLAAAQRTPDPGLSDVADAIEAIYHEDGYFLAEAMVAKDGRSIVVREGEIGGDRRGGRGRPNLPIGSRLSRTTPRPACGQPVRIRAW